MSEISVVTLALLKVQEAEARLGLEKSRLSLAQVLLSRSQKCPCVVGRVTERTSLSVGGSCCDFCGTVDSSWPCGKRVRTDSHCKNAFEKGLGKG